jgi:hypothetical protein
MELSYSTSSFPIKPTDPAVTIVCMYDSNPLTYPSSEGNRHEMNVTAIRYKLNEPN